MARLPIDNFIEIEFDIESLDVFHIRSSILGAIQKNSPFLKGNLIDIGCGKMPYKNYILENTQVETYVGLDLFDAKTYSDEIKPDWRWDGVKMPFSDGSFTSALGTEVLEHCPKPDIVLKETFRVLQPRGYFFFTVPFLWNLHEIPFDEYRYTPFALERLLREAGFDQISISIHGGWHASLAQMLGLWVKRAPMSKRKRRFFSLFLKPIIKNLLNKDDKISWDYNKKVMITGMSGIARKPDQ